MRIGEDRSTFIVCVLIATAFWLMVKLSKSYQVDKIIYFSYDHPADQVFSKSPPRKVATEVEGIGWDLMYDFFLRKRVEINYNLSGESNVFLTEARMRNDIESALSSRDLKLSVFNQEEVDLGLEKKIEKVVPVDLKLNIQFGANSQYRQKGQEQLEPREVVVSGPVSLVNEINSWPTDSLYVQNPTTSIERIVGLQQPPSELSLDITKVKLFIPVERYTEKSFFIPVAIKNGPDSIKIFPRQIKVNCIVGLSQYNEVKEEDFVLEANFTGVDIENSTTVPIILTEYPPFVKDVFYSPKSAEFFVIKEEKETALNIEQLPPKPMAVQVEQDSLLQ